jgi:hypothetical protein
MTPQWTALFNRCLNNGKLPVTWRECVMVLIPKGKGPLTEPTSWRGIAKKSCVYKLLASLLAGRLTAYVEHKKALPDEQHGFRAQRSTITACTILLADIEATLARKGQFMFSVFVDFRAAFDSGSRTRVLQKLAEIGVPERILMIVMDILQANQIILDDGVAEHPAIDQTTGFAQGDNLSPLLFALLVQICQLAYKIDTQLLKSLCTQTVSRNLTALRLWLCHRPVLYSSSRHHLQQALATLSAFVNEVGLEINTQKTEAMKFRHGGRIAENDVLRLDGQNLGYVNKCTYLGITVTPSGQSFAAHIEQRTRKAIIASTELRSPQSLSVKTALALFDMKIAPIAWYGIQLLWGKLGLANLEALDRVKPAYLKRVLRLHTSTRNRYTYLLCETPLFVEQIRKQFALPETPAYLDFITQYENKMAEVDPTFYTTGAMINTNWKGTGRKNRHIMTRFAIHGFHHLICQTNTYHEPCNTCICKYCDNLCTKYHGNECNIVASITRLATTS